MRPDQVHAADPRILGDAEDESLPEALRGSFETLLGARAPPIDTEETELDTFGSQRTSATLDSCGRVSNHEESRNVCAAPQPLPSWEAFLGGAADLLYYAPHVRADYTPFLVGCVGSSGALRRFHDALYFSTVPRALAELRIDEETRPMSRVRSLIYRPSSGAGAPAPPSRRPMAHCSSCRPPLPTRAAPIDRYLKARGRHPPRTWVSGIAAQLETAGAGELVAATRAWYRASVDRLLADPKGADLEGDNFAAWLRACHPEIYADIDTSDPSQLAKQRWAQSRGNSRHRYKLNEIKIPSAEAAFEELVASRRADPIASSAREQVLSKILIDAFQLRLVDVSMVMKTASIAGKAPHNAKVVVVLYAGADHSRSVAQFWRTRGFTASGLPNRGMVGKEHYRNSESRCLTFPPYLHDLGLLFPVPGSAPDAATKASA